MRDGDWKVLASLKGLRLRSVDTRHEAAVKKARPLNLKIYKITNDINESKDLSKSHPEKLAELKEKLDKYYLELIEDSHIWGK